MEIRQSTAVNGCTVLSKRLGFRVAGTARRNVVIVFAALASLASVGISDVRAQEPKMLGGPISIPVPDQSNAIPLYGPRHAVGPAEQWEKAGQTRMVRNVTEPTLTRFLPDPGKATGAAVIVAPGGGFLTLVIDIEGYEVAQWLADHGIAAFVLKYRSRETPRDQADFAAVAASLGRPSASLPNLSMVPANAFEDAKAAVRMVRSHAQDWHVDPNRVGFVGFSAGAMLTLSVGLTDDLAARPNFIAPIYGPLGEVAVPSDAPPLFVAVSLDDPVMARGNIFGLISSWRKAGRPVEAHFYGMGGHGFGMTRPSAATALWIDEFYAWMSDSHMLKPLPAAANPGGYSTYTSLGALLDDPKTHAVLERLIPTLVDSPSISMVRGMTLRQLRTYASSVLTDDMLAKIEIELAKLGSGTH
jgi:acetyl esterase/lipase